VERRGHEVLDTKEVETELGRADIYNGVDSAHLVEMDLIDGGAVDRGLGMAQGVKCGIGGIFYRLRQATFINELLDVRKMSVRVVMMMFVAVPVIMVMVMMFVAVPVIMVMVVVFVAVPVIMVMVVVFVAVPVIMVMMVVFVAVLVIMVMMVVMTRESIDHAELCSVNALLNDLLGSYVIAVDTERLKSILDGFKIRAGVNKRADRHIAADAAIAVKVASFHGNTLRVGDGTQLKWKRVVVQMHQDGTSFEA